MKYEKLNLTRNIPHSKRHLPPQSLWWVKFVFLHFPLPTTEPEAKPQNLMEDIEKKKPKKPKKTTNTSITGFEEAFEQFATSNIKTSNNVSFAAEVAKPLIPKQSDIPADNKLDVSATQVRLSRSKSIVFFPLTCNCVQHCSTLIYLTQQLLLFQYGKMKLLDLKIELNL